MAVLASKNHFNHQGEYSNSSSFLQPNLGVGKARLQPCLSARPKGGLSLKNRTLWDRLCPRLPRYYIQIMTVVLLCACMVTPALAVDDMWTVAKRIIVDVYNKIAGISTVLAGLMSAVAVIGAKVSNNQHKVDQSWDWLKRIWMAWAVINGIGAFLAYVQPLFSGLNTIQ